MCKNKPNNKRTLSTKYEKLLNAMIRGSPTCSRKKKLKNEKCFRTWNHGYQHYDIPIQLTILLGWLTFKASIIGGIEEKCIKMIKNNIYRFPRVSAALEKSRYVSRVGDSTEP
jgi:hypothetical protein